MHLEVLGEVSRICSFRFADSLTAHTHRHSVWLGIFCLFNTCTLFVYDGYTDAQCYYGEPRVLHFCANYFADLFVKGRDCSKALPRSLFCAASEMYLLSDMGQQAHPFENRINVGNFGNPVADTADIMHQCTAVCMCACLCVCVCGVCWKIIIEVAKGGRPVLLKSQRKAPSLSHPCHAGVYKHAFRDCDCDCNSGLLCCVSDNKVALC